jgi:hypothetical protein
MQAFQKSKNAFLNAAFSELTGVTPRARSPDFIRTPSTIGWGFLIIVVWGFYVLTRKILIQ